MIFAMTDEILWWGLNVLIQYFQTQSTKGIVKPKNFIIIQMLFRSDMYIHWLY